jgi:N-dimethylarginine dimethylaminohydrolase
MITYQSDFKKIKSMLVKHPKDAFIDQQHADERWENLFYTSRPDVSKAIDDYESFLEVFRTYDIELHFLPDNDKAGLDSIYVRDASICTNGGMIISNMGKDARKDEPTLQHSYFSQNGIPVLGTVSGNGTIEGGDVAWIDEDTLGIARGYRTNQEGIEQVKRLLKDHVEEVIVMDSPHFRGPSDVFHLMSVYSPVDTKKAVVYSPLMSVPFRQELVKRGVQLIEVPEKEFDTLGCNVLAIAPDVCLIAEGNPETSARMKSAGLEVITFDGGEISLKGNGGPTCLTRPMARES